MTTSKYAPHRGVLAAVLALGLAAMALSACNTTAGVGKDVSAAGNAVSNTAKDVQKKL